MGIFQLPGTPLNQEKVHREGTGKGCYLFPSAHVKLELGHAMEQSK